MPLVLRGSSRRSGPKGPVSRPFRIAAACLGSVIAATLVAAPAWGSCEPARGSAPAIMAKLAPLIVGASGDAARIEPPFGPPQGALDPKLQAFLEGRGDFAFLTRELAEADLATFRAHHDGRAPTVIPVAAGNWNRFGYVDAVAVVVHRSNPVTSLSRAQLDAIFSTTRWRGHDPVATWGDLGVSGSLGASPVRLAGGLGWAPTESARALTIRRHVLSLDGRVGLWRPAPESGSEADVVERVGRDPAGIGFTGMGHLSDEVRAVPIEDVPLTAQTARSGLYPLLRSVDLLIDAPGETIDPRLERLARSLLAPEGQAILERQGDFAALPEGTLEHAHRLLGSLKPARTCAIGREP